MIEHLNSLPLAGLLVVVSIGYILGNVAFRRVSLGPAGATLFVSLLLGHFGLRSSDVSGGEGNSFSLGMFGFILFIYSVGFEAGPRFFASFRDRTGWKYALVAAAVNAVAVLVTFAVATALALSPTRAAGAMAGAFTSAPTFAAALELAGEPTDISIAFALTYPIGLVGVVLLVQLAPGLLYPDSATGLPERETQEGDVKRHVRYERGSPEVYRVLQVERHAAIGKSVRELDVSQKTGCVLTWIKRGENIFLATADTKLDAQDHVAAIGRVDELQALQELLGKEVFDEQLQTQLVAPRRIQVRSPKAIGRTLSELRVTDRYQCVITRIERGSLWIEPRADVVLLRGDIVTVVGRRDHVHGLAQLMGRFRPRYQETDIAVYTAGMVLGVLLGDIEFRLGGMTLGPGMAGGLLFAGLLLGWLSELGLLRANVPRQARQLVRDLGVLLFIGETGLAAGQDLSTGLSTGALPTVLVGTLAMLAAVLVALLFALRVLKLTSINALGCISGGLTSSAALHAVRRITDSNEATVSYVAAYATSSVLATVSGRLIMRLMQ